MPYRRLPNTDIARKRALERALELGRMLRPEQLAFNQSTLQKIEGILANFDQAIIMQKEATTRQRGKSNDYKNSLKKAKLYISHFLQVFNFAVERGEIKASSRQYFGINPKQSTLPQLITEIDVIEMGKKLIKGENERIVKRETPITCPKIAVVKVYYDEFVEKMNFQKMLQSITTRANEKVASLRPQVDELILKIWNEVEAYYSNEPIDRMRELSAYYGITYVYRPYEKEYVRKRKVS